MIVQKSRAYVYKLATVARYVLMVLLALIFALPIIYMGVSSFKSYWQILGDIRSIRAFLPVGDLSFANYKEAFRHVPVARFFSSQVERTRARFIGDCRYDYHTVRGNCDPTAVNGK
jgi:ABC-type glycerol-3-phosphate transport system permease component